MQERFAIGRAAVSTHITQLAGAALLTEALRANFEERLQDRQGVQPDVSAFFAAQPSGPTYDTAGPIQRPEVLDAPQTQALSKDRWRLKMYWVRTRPPRPREELPRHSMPTFYYPPPAHIVIINADWPPLTRLVERETERTRLAVVWDSTYPLMEREIADALAVAFRNAAPKSDELNAALRERLLKRLPQIERRLQDALERRVSGPS